MGTIVGAGYLGIPYAVSRIGFWWGIGLIFALGGLLMLQFFAVAEISLRTHAKHQIAGYVSKYLGRRWRRAIDALIILEAYGALLAYLVGEGQVLSSLFGGSPQLMSLMFFLVTSFAVYAGLKFIERAELALTIVMAIVIVAIAAISWSSFNSESINVGYGGNILSAYGVIFFAFLGGAAIPEMRLALIGLEKKLPKAIVIGTVIPIIVYLLFTAAVLGVTGASTTEIATVGLGDRLGRTVDIIGNALAAVTMTTAFLGLALALKETFRFDMRFRRDHAFILTLVGPIALLLLGLNNFIEILLIVGAVFGGLQGIIVVLTWWQAKLHGDRKPEFSLAHSRLIGYTLMSVFFVGLVYTLLHVGGTV